MADRRGEVTRLLESGKNDALLDLVYDELRGIAAHHMSRERPNHTLQPTALVHEAFLRLFETEAATWAQRRHFYAAASQAMRRILIEHARRNQAERRGGGAQRVTLAEGDEAIEVEVDQAVQLADALETLAREDERAAMVAHLRFLAGLEVEETAKVLEISVRTVHREWAFARARLAQLVDG